MNMPPVADANLKKCPFCAELVQADAKVCRHCGRDLDRTTLIAQSLGKLGTSMTSLGCLLTLFVSVPICVCLVVYLFAQQ